MNEDKSLTTRKEHALTKSQHTGGLIDKHLSNLLDQNSPNVQTIEWEDGIYVGELLDGIPHGQGTSTYPDGDKYVGEYKDGKMHGHGTYTVCTGHKYVGEWKGDKCNGQGTDTSPDGHKYEGEYMDGQRFRGTFWNGTLCDSEGNVLATCSEGE
jgi:hypothetical protein